MLTFIAILGLFSFVSIFVGTAIAILLVSYVFAGKVLLASLLVFVFALISYIAYKDDEKTK